MHKCITYEIIVLYYAYVSFIIQNIREYNLYNSNLLQQLSFLLFMQNAKRRNYLKQFTLSPLTLCIESFINHDEEKLKATNIIPKQFPRFSTSCLLSLVLCLLYLTQILIRDAIIIYYSMWLKVESRTCVYKNILSIRIQHTVICLCRCTLGEADNKQVTHETNYHEAAETKERKWKELNRMWKLNAIKRY